MPRSLQRLLRLLPRPTGARIDRRLAPTRARHAQFASFLESCGYRVHDVDRYERSLRRRRAVRSFLYWLSAVGASWIVLESAKALTLF